MSDRSPRDRSLLVDRRQALLLGAAAAGSAWLAPRLARAATVPYLFEMNRSAGFFPDPNQHVRVGYVTQLSGLGASSGMAADMTVATAWTGPRPTYAPVASAPAGGGMLTSVRVVGVMERLAWNGGVLDPLAIDLWVSQANATMLKSMQQNTLPSNLSLSSLGFWVAGYDAQAKVSFEQFFPLSQPTVAGTINPASLSVDLTGTPAKLGMDVMVYKVSLSVAPAGAQYQLSAATSSTSRVVAPWGVVLKRMTK